MHEWDGDGGGHGRGRELEDIVEKEEEDEDRPPVFHSQLARSVYELFHSRQSTLAGKSDLFLPGRMTYEFDLDPHFSPDLPSIVIHSKQEYDQYSKRQDRLNCTLNNSTKQRLSQIFQQRAHKTHRRKEQETEDVKMEVKEEAPLLPPKIE